MSDLILFQVTKAELCRALQESNMAFGTGEIDKIVEKMAKMGEELKSGSICAIIISIRHERIARAAEMNFAFPEVKDKGELSERKDA